MKLKEEKGITLISLALTIILLLIITSVVIYNSTNYVTMKKLNDLYIDIEAISSKVDEYYLKYGELPILCKYVNKEKLKELINNIEKDREVSKKGDLNPDDGEEEYYVIDLEKLDGLSLTYGYDDEYKNIRNNKHITESKVEDKIFIINSVTHQIYFPHGIFVDGYMYYYMD